MFHVSQHLKKGGTASLKSWVVANIVDHHDQSISHRSNHQGMFSLHSQRTTSCWKYKHSYVSRGVQKFYTISCQLTLKNNPTIQTTEEYHTTHSHRIDVDETDNVHIPEHW